MKKFKDFFVNSFFFYLVIEFIEEFLEDLISLGISALLIKGVSTLFVVSITQGVKVVAKRIVKRITYKEGNDKMKKLKSFFALIWANKKSIIGTLCSLLSGVATFVATNKDAFLELPELLIFGFNVSPIIAGVLVIAGVEVGVVGKGFESVKQFFDRVENNKVVKEAKKELATKEKEEKALIKEAKKELANEEKVAIQKQVEEEKAKAKAEAEAKAKAEKEKADAEHIEKLEAIKAKIKAENKVEDKIEEVQLDIVEKQLED